MTVKILLNKAQCKNCKSIIESKHKHEWMRCECFRNRKKGETGIYVSGGTQYKVKGGNLNNFIRIKEYKIMTGLNITTLLRAYQKAQVQELFYEERRKEARRGKEKDIFSELFEKAYARRRLFQNKLTIKVEVQERKSESLETPT